MGKYNFVERILRSIYLRKEYIYLQEPITCWKYSDLLKYIEFYSYELISNNCEKIMIFGEQKFQVYAMLIAAYLSKVTFCVIDNKLPEEKIDIYLSKFKPDLVFQGDKGTNIYKKEYRVINWKRESPSSEYKINLSEIERRNNNVAYVYFTSGSTGQPKGCELLRQAFENFCDVALSLFNLDSNDVWGQYVPLYFDMSLIDVFGVILTGCKMVSFPSFKEKMKPHDIIWKNRVTFLNIVPHILDIMERTGGIVREKMCSLKKIRFGGDKLTKEKVEKLFEVMPDLKIISTYGLTETTCFCFYKEILRDNYLEYCHPNVTIGQPISGWNAYIDGGTDTGELVIYGRNIGKGYIEEDPLKRFRWIKVDGEYVYAYFTGDYVKCINSNYYYIGRKDFQIKVNGIRVDLQELEIAMCEMDCNNINIFYREGIYVFCSYKKGDFDENEIKEKLREKIPSCLLPKKIWSIEAIQIKETGKLDIELIERIILKFKKGKKKCIEIDC